MRFVLWLHLIAASVWVGGLVTLGALVTAVRKAGVERSVLQVMARAFGRVSWTAMGVAVLTGGLMAIDHLSSPWLPAKMGLVALVAALAGWHQFAAGRQSPAMRGMLQAAILVVSLAIVAVGILI